MEKLKSPTKKI